MQQNGRTLVRGHPYPATLKRPRSTAVLSKRTAVSPLSRSSVPLPVCQAVPLAPGLLGSQTEEKSTAQLTV